MKRSEFLTLPNAITFYRVIAGPVCMWLLTSDQRWSAWAALAVVLTAEFSDLIDGTVARASKQVSNFGKILDPMADCLYRGSVFIAFVIEGWMPIWMLSIFVWRDLTVSYLREIAELRSNTLAARFSGKLKAVVQGVAQVAVVGIVAFAGKESLGAFSTVITVLLLTAAAITAYSLFDYTVGVLKQRTA